MDPLRQRLRFHSKVDLRMLGANRFTCGFRHPTLDHRTHRIHEVRMKRDSMSEKRHQLKSKLLHVYIGVCEKIKRYFSESIFDLRRCSVGVRGMPAP